MNSPDLNHPIANSSHCWRAIGVWGDRSCEQLKQAIHCRNCSVYSSAGRTLLEREAPPEYLDEWTDLPANEEDAIALHRSASRDRISVGIFRLGVEWLGLPAPLFKEVTQMQTIHSLPHRSNNVFLGLVNIRGEIQMCVSLASLLGLDVENNGELVHDRHVIYPRMVVLEKESQRWVFAVDEIYGIHRFHATELQQVPATVSKRTETYAKGILYWQERRVGLLDEELLFYTLNRRVL